jgi:hypothetical protein
MKQAKARQIGKEFWCYSSFWKYFWVEAMRRGAINNALLWFKTITVAIHRARGERDVFT